MDDASSFPKTTRRRWLRKRLLLLLLVAVPVISVAQTIGWQPLSLDFGIVPIGATEYRTLTLTNTHATEPLDIENVEFDYNDRNVFGLSTSEPLPAVLPPGEHLDVVFSFTPTDLSFFMADVMITNDSTNAPGLYYGLLGQGEFSDPCGPDFTNCSGQCVDTTTDIDNCGSCGNVCPSVANATAVCENFSCGFICDEGYEPIGGACYAVGQTAEQLLEGLIAFVNDSVGDGTFVGLGAGQSGPGRLDAFRGWLDKALIHLESAEPNAACSRLNAAQLRSDGGWPFVMPPDFVAGEARAEVYERILGVMSAMEDCVPSEAPTRPTS